MEISQLKSVIEKLLVSQYESAYVEKEILAFWESLKVYAEDLSDTQNLFVIALPPPNVTGILHMGHAFEHSLSDFLVRFNKLNGKKVVWIPGTDHAGIATQSVVEKNLIKQNIRKEVIGREKFIEYVWQWVKKCETTIKEQCKRLGDFLYWDLYAFTMDEKRSYAVAYAFEKLYNDGFIYRDKYIVNYCPKCKTALSDDEVEFKEVKGKLYFINYPLASESGKYLTIATVRPETILADVAVAVHPQDERYKSYVGQKVILPLVNRHLPVISDNYVDPKFGTGVLKITPAHDFNDYTIGKKHNLPVIEVIDNRGKMNENAGCYKGLDRFECRKQIVEDLKKQGFLVKIEDYTHRVGHCYRCETVIEPNISLQWFVRMQPLARMVKDSYQRGEFEIVPSKYENMFFHWLDNIRDWCISRQLWWGHRIPFYTCKKCNYSFARASPPQECLKCHNTQLKQDPDVLDTWFSSWLWPLSTTGWLSNEKLFSILYPTTALTSAWDILFFWDIRMLMSGLYFTGKPPFKTLLLHGLVRDERNRKLSKSLGNAPDLDKLVEQFGADGVRLGFLLNATLQDDFILSQNTFTTGKHFSNKLWNAMKFFVLNAKNLNYRPTIKTSGFSLPQSSDARSSVIIKWIYTELALIEQELKNNVANYNFMNYTRSLYRFLWNKFCDWYIELTKEKIKKGEYIYIDAGLDILRRFIIYWHPVQPFITEFIYQTFKTIIWDEKKVQQSSIINEKIAPVPANLVSTEDKEIIDEVIKLEGLFRAIKHLKKIKGKGNFVVAQTHPNKKIETVIEITRNFEDIEIASEEWEIFYDIEICNTIVKVKLEKDRDLLVHLVEKSEAEIKELQQKILDIENKLYDNNFLKNAEPQLIENYRMICAQLKKEINILESNRERLSKRVSTF